MRSVHVIGGLVDLEIIAHACADVAAGESIGDDEPRVRVVVNGETLGLVPSRVWERVRSHLESLLGDDISIDEDASDEAKGAAPARARESDRRPPTLRALVAVHVPAVRSALMAALYVAGFDAVAVADGARGVGQLVSHAPHVVVADFELPRVAGDVLLKKAREVRGASLRAAVLIGAALPELLVPPCDAADLVVGQPFDAARVVELVDELLAAEDELDDDAEIG